MSHLLVTYGYIDIDGHQRNVLYLWGKCYVDVLRLIKRIVEIVRIAGAPWPTLSVFLWKL